MKTAFVAIVASLMVICWFILLLAVFDWAESRTKLYVTRRSLRHLIAERAIDFVEFVVSAAMIIALVVGVPVGIVVLALAIVSRL